MLHIYCYSRLPPRNPLNPFFNLFLQINQHKLVKSKHEILFRLLEIIYFSTYIWLANIWHVHCSKRKQERGLSLHATYLMQPNPMQIYIFTYMIVNTPLVGGLTTSRANTQTSGFFSGWCLGSCIIIASRWLTFVKKSSRLGQVLNISYM